MPELEGKPILANSAVFFNIAQTAFDFDLFNDFQKSASQQKLFE